MYLSTITFFVLLAVIVIAKDDSQCKDDGGQCVDTGKDINPIKIVLDEGFWDPQEIAKSRVPTIIKDSLDKVPWPVNQWTAHMRWSLDYLSRRLPKLMVNNLTALLPNKKYKEFTLRKPYIPGRHIPEIERTTELSFSEVSGRTLLMKRTDPKHLLYYQNALDEMKDLTIESPESARSLLSEIDPFSPLVVLDEPTILDSPDGIRPTIWLSQRRVVAQTHYDISNNFHVLLTGRKKITLYPPSEWPNLYLFPHLSTSDRQTQVSKVKPQPDLFPNFENAKGYDMVLRANEILYIPPFWFHRVESFYTSVSVSIISPSSEEIKWNDILGSTALDYGPGKQPSFVESVFCLKFFLSYLFDNLPGSDNVVDFMKKLYDTRYEPLMNKLSPLITDISQNDPRPAISDTCFWDHRNEDGQLTREVILERKNWLQASAQLMLDQLAEAQLDQSIRDICLGNFVERVLSVIFGADNTPLFIKNCFSTYTTKDTEDINDQQSIAQ